MAHDLTTKIPLDFSFLYHPAESKISTKARHRGLNYWLKGYVHDIKLDDDQDKNILKITAKCYRSYKKSEVPHKLLMDIDIEKKKKQFQMSCAIHAKSGVYFEKYLLS